MEKQIEQTPRKIIRTCELTDREGNEIGIWKNLNEAVNMASHEICYSGGKITPAMSVALMNYAAIRYCVPGWRKKEDEKITCALRICGYKYNDGKGILQTHGLLDVSGWSN